MSKMSSLNINAFRVTMWCYVEQHDLNQLKTELININKTVPPQIHEKIGPVYIQ
jgi:hypothetical protein